MANHNLPGLTDTYTNVLTYIDARLDDLALGLSSTTTTPTNLPTNSIRWNSTNKNWEIWSGTAWGALAANYNVQIGDSTNRNPGFFTTINTNGIATLGASSTMNGSVIVNLADAQSITGIKTFTTPKILSTGSFSYDFAVSTLTASRTITLPLLTGNDTFVFEAHTQTLSNKTLTSPTLTTPKIATGGFIADENGNEQIKFVTTASAVNEVTHTNAATGSDPSISATGGDTDIDLVLLGKGTGTVKAGGTAAGNQVATIGGAETLTSKTLTLPKITSGSFSYDFAVSALTASRTVTLPLLGAADTFVFEAHTQTLTNKTMGTGSTWSGNTLGVTVGGTGTNTAPTQGGIIFGSSTTAYGSTLAGTSGQLLVSAGTGTPVWQSFDFLTHAPSLSYKKIVRATTTGNLDATSYSSGVLTGYSTTASTNVTATTSGSLNVTVASTATIKVGAVVSVATVQLAAGTVVASINSATGLTVTARANITSTALSAVGTAATATFAAQTYAPYAVGSTIVVSGAAQTAYNGSWTVTACTTTTVTFTIATSGPAADTASTITFNIPTSAVSTSTSFAQTIAALNTLTDGVTLSAGDRVLVKDQTHFQGLTSSTPQKYNGIYTVTTVGTTAVPFVLTRAADADATADLDGALVNISEGTVNGGKSFKISGFTGTSTFDSSAIYFHRLIDTSGSSIAQNPTATARGFDLDIEPTTQWLSGGTLADLAVVAFGQRTINAQTASTYTRASTLYIAGAPVQGTTGATLTNTYALYVAGGAAQFQGTVNGLTLSSSQVTTATTNGAMTYTSAGTGAATFDSAGGGAVNLATGGTAKTITIGNVTGATSTTIRSGTGNTTINGGTLTFTPTARTSGSAGYLTVTTPADTTLAASVESIGTSFTAATRQFSTGALTLQRERVFAAPTYGFVAASTLTEAVNVDIAVPVAGTNATITNSWALRSAAAKFTGAVRLEGTTTFSGLTASRVPYINASNQLATGNLSFDNTTLGITGDLTVSGNTTLGNANTDNTTISGYVGIGSIPNSAYNLVIGSPALIGDAQISTLINTIFGTDAGTMVTGLKINTSTGISASAYTTTYAYQLYIADIIKGTNNTITNQYGIYVENLTSAGTNYGIYHGVTSGTNKWGIYGAGNAANYLSGSLSIGTTDTTYKAQIGNGTETIMIHPTTGLNKIGSASNTTLSLVVNATEVARLTAGKVGINLGGSTDPAVSLDISATDAMRVPKGTTAQRPTGAAAYFRFNSDTSKFEGYNGSAWGTVGGGATGGGTDTVFVENDSMVSYDYTLGQSAMATCTISIASPAVVTIANDFVAGQMVRFTTTGALPTGLSTNVAYYVLSTGLSTASFRVSTTPEGTAVVTSGTQSGVQQVGKVKNASSAGPVTVANGKSVTIPSGSVWTII